MKTIALASQNPVKIQATRLGFQRMFPQETYQFISITTFSGVSAQPMTDEETLIGARTRAEQATRQAPGAAFALGIEGGVELRSDGMIAFAWVVIMSQNRIGKGRTGSFYLPDEVARLVLSGKELGEADDIVFQRSNSKQENGAVGLLTGNVIDRTQLYEQAVILALIPFKNPSHYKPTS